MCCSGPFVVCCPTVTSKQDTVLEGTHVPAGIRHMFPHTEYRCLEHNLTRMVGDKWLGHAGTK